MRPVAILVLCAYTAASLPVGAQVYRWTDDRGRVTYGNLPPADAARLTRLDADAGRAGDPVKPVLGTRRAREFAGAAIPAPSEFPGLVDRTTVAAARRSLEERDCAVRRARCGDAAVAVAPQGGALLPLSALQVP